MSVAVAKHEVQDGQIDKTLDRAGAEARRNIIPDRLGHISDPGVELFIPKDRLAAKLGEVLNVKRPPAPHPVETPGQIGERAVRCLDEA